jgi:hypothetical protein
MCVADGVCAVTIDHQGHGHVCIQIWIKAEALVGSKDCQWPAFPG